MWFFREISNILVIAFRVNSERLLVTAHTGCISYITLIGRSLLLRHWCSTSVTWLMTVIHFFNRFGLLSLACFKQASLKQCFWQQPKHLQKWAFKNYYNPSHVKSSTFFFLFSSDSHSQVCRDVIYVLDTLISDFFSFNSLNWKKVCCCWFMKSSEVPGIILNVHSCSAVV